MSAGLRLLLDRIERSGRPPPPLRWAVRLLSLAAVAWAVLLGLIALVLS